MENREMQTSNTEEMVTISRAEYERFQEQAQASSVIYSLIETAKENGLDPAVICYGSCKTRRS